MFLASCDNFIISAGTTGLNNRYDPTFSGNVDIIAEREKRVAGQHNRSLDPVWVSTLHLLEGDAH